ncbi:RNA recognition motif domain [Trinorchestia longiramus]|nr:RNA recognition motif domain [Trinorchestia longiramus]
MFNIHTIGTGMLVKAEPGGLLATGGHKADNSGGHSADHSSAVAIPGHHVSQMVNGSSAGSPAGSSGRSSPADPAPNKLFVGGLSWQTTSERLKEYFSSYGTVKDVLIMKDPITQGTRQVVWVGGGHDKWCGWGTRQVVWVGDTTGGGGGGHAGGMGGGHEG